MKLTKTKLKQLIKEELSEVFPDEVGCMRRELEECAEDFRITVEHNFPRLCSINPKFRVRYEPIVYSCEMLTLEIEIEGINSPEEYRAVEGCLKRFAKIAATRGFDKVGCSPILNIEFSVERESPLYKKPGEEDYSKISLIFIMREKEAPV